LNILFVLYNDFNCNSAIHVHNFANLLTRLGHSVAVAVPKNKATCSNLGERSYQIANFSEASDNCFILFDNKQPPNVVHAWTPRENVRRFCEKVKQVCPYALVVHLEDNEEVIVEANLKMPFSEAAKLPDSALPLSLSHPNYYREFLAQASGITIIMDRLQEFVPATTPALLLWPGADPELFHPRKKDLQFAEQLRIPANSTVFCYTGNVHAANAREVRSLYLAVAVLNREGVPTTLVRAGRDYYPFLGSDDRWAHKYSIELGHVEHVDIGRVLSLADFLIQPGAPNDFNEYRLPSKLPEFFAMGRPVILPRTNVGRFLEHGRDAWVLPTVDALGIVETVKYLQANSALIDRLSEGAIETYKQHFDWKEGTCRLDRFYRGIVQERSEALASDRQMLSSVDGT